MAYIKKIKLPNGTNEDLMGKIYVDTVSNWSPSSGHAPATDLRKGELAAAYASASDFRGYLAIALRDNANPFDTTQFLLCPTAESTMQIAENQAESVLADKIVPVQRQVDWNTDNGVKNLLEVTATTTTVNGITFTVNTDGTITANGTATGTNGASLRVGQYPKGNGDVIINGVTGGSVDTTYWFSLSVSGGNAFSGRLGSWADGDRAVNYDDDSRTIYLYVGIKTGQTVNNLVFKPMLRPACIEDDTFHPYAPSNRELYEMILALQAQLGT